MSFISVGMSDWSFLPSSSAAPGKPPPSCLDTSAASRRFDASGRFHLSPSTSAYPMAASNLFPRVSRSCSTRRRRRWAPPERQATTRRSMRSRPRALFMLALALLCVSARFQGASSQHPASEIWTQLERRSTGLDSIHWDFCFYLSLTSWQNYGSKDFWNDIRIDNKKINWATLETKERSRKFRFRFLVQVQKVQSFFGSWFRLQQRRMLMKLWPMKALHIMANNGRKSLPSIS